MNRNSGFDSQRTIQLTSNTQNGQVCACSLRETPLSCILWVWSSEVGSWGCSRDSFFYGHADTSTGATGGNAVGVTSLLTAKKFLHRVFCKSKIHFFVARTTVVHREKLVRCVPCLTERIRVFDE